MYRYIYIFVYAHEHISYCRLALENDIHTRGTCSSLSILDVEEPDREQIFKESEINLRWNNKVPSVVFRLQICSNNTLIQIK